MKTFCFFWSSPNFRQKIGPNLSENLFWIYLFVLNLILGGRIDLRTPWKNFSLRPWVASVLPANISTVSYTSLTYGIKSHASLSAADAFRKILNDKSEILFNHV